MKSFTKSSNITLTILCIGFSLLFTSCGGGKEEVSVEELIQGEDLNAMKSKRDQLKTTADSLLVLYDKLNLKVQEMDSELAGFTLVDATKLVDTVYNHYVQLQANIETKQDVQISPEYSGVIRLRVTEGQRVGRGATLGTIDDGGLRDQLTQAKISVDQARAQVKQAEAQVQQARIQADLAKVTFQKQSNLWKQKIGSEIQFLQAKTEYEAAEQQVKVNQKQVQVAQQQVSAAQKGVSNVQAQLAKTNLRAPFSGVVEEIITKSGQVVAPGVPVLRLVNPSTIKASAEVPENYLPNIKVGTKALVEIPSLNETIEGKVSLVGASINPNNRTFTVEVPLDPQGGKIKPNLNAQIKLNDYSKEEAIVIPESVIQYDSENAYVYVIDNYTNGQGVAKKVVIETGVESNAEVEVLSGLKSGDILVTEGVNKIQEGDKVKTIQ